ncbi:hypothetical protein ACIRLA_45200 [Streptomyces sp. NPDC102364]|uniref:hypothetical protein n=1 Tax=Streptomyces sp. NPDC102364 TaxID=3366161 RepID=UPI00381EAF00
MEDRSLFSDPAQSSWPSFPAPRPRLDALAQALERITELEHTARAGEHQHTEMKRRLDRIERQLGVLLADRLEERSDLPGARHGEHQTLARRFRTLIEQDFVTFARRFADRCDHVLDWPAAERSARLIGILSERLFARSLPSKQHLVRQLRLADHAGHAEAAIADLYNRCTDLAARIHEAGLHHSWDFTATIGDHVDPARQDAWPRCDSRAPISFVMAPAYLVDGHIYSPQIVYTRP